MQGIIDGNIIGVNKGDTIETMDHVGRSKSSGLFLGSPHNKDCPILSYIGFFYSP